MIRRSIHHKWKGEAFFRWRGGDVSRLEGLTDAAIAFALTLIVVSLEVPQDFTELRTAMLSFPVFAACFGILIWIWSVHYLYHRRFGFEDPLTIALNSFLLFTILFYVYPMKFVALRVVGDASFDRAHVQELMVIYSSGFTAIFVLFAAMYFVAWRRRDALELDDTERYLTKAGVRTHLLTVGLGVVSIVLALSSVKGSSLAGLIYMLLGPIHGLNGYLVGRSVERIAEAEQAREHGSAA